MPKKRDYDTEVLEALARAPANAISLRRALHIASGRMCDILESLEDAGKIEWRQTSKTDGVWEISKEGVVR